MTRTDTVLSISIALNIFLLGSVGGAAFWYAHGERMIIAGSLRVAGSELPVEERSAFRKSLREARRALAGRQAEAREARAHAVELLRQPTLDATAVAAALDQARSAELAIRSAIETRALDFVKTLPADDRKVLADAIERRGKLRASDED